MKDLITQLLQKDPKNRLGTKGKKDVMNHPWFKDINWKKLYRKEIKSPFVPEIKEKTIKSHILSGIGPLLGFNKKRRDEEGDVSETQLGDKKMQLVRNNSHKFANF